MKENKIKYDKKCIFLIILLAILIFLLICILVTIIIINLVVVQILFYDDYLALNSTIKSPTETTLQIDSTDTTEDIYNQNLIFPLTHNKFKTVTSSSYFSSNEIENTFDEFEKNCGIARYESNILKNHKLNKRIINGEEAVEHSYPW
jgi:cell division protein FtsI/penicillin-binding protein 2